MTINALGQTLTSTDRNGTVHGYAYDVLGRLTDDTVTTLGTDVDGAVRRIRTEYDPQGNAFRFTSFSDTAGTGVVNQCSGFAGDSYREDTGNICTHVIQTVDRVSGSISFQICGVQKCDRMTVQNVVRQGRRRKWLPWRRLRPRPGPGHRFICSLLGPARVR